MDGETRKNPGNGNGNIGLTLRAHGALEDARAAAASHYPDLFAVPARTAIEPAISFRALMRWKRTILGVTAALAFILMAGIWTMVEPQYSSTAVIRVASSVPRVLYKTEDNGTVPLFNAYINTQVSVIQSPEVLSRVFDREDVRATEWFGSSNASSGDVSRLIDRLARQLSVTLRRGTELVDIAVETRRPQDAAVIVNAVAEEYKEFWDEMQSESERQRLSALRDQLTSVQDRIKELFEHKFALAEQMGTTLHEEVRTQMLNDLRGKRAALEMMREERQLRELERANPDQPAGATQDRIDADMMDAIRLANVPMEVQTDATWLRYQEDYVVAKKRLDLAKRQFGEAHPSLQSAIADLDQARRMLRLTEQRLGLEPYSYVANSKLVEHREAELDDSIAELQTQLADADGRVQDLARTDEMYNEQKLMRKDLMDRLHALETESNAPARISLQSAGLVRLTPSSDRRFLFTACALLVSTAIGLGAGYLRGRTDPKIHEFADINTGVSRDIPFLGQLPRAQNILEMEDDTLLGQAINENIRIIRTMLLQRVAEHSAVVLTSPEPNSGKTSVAVLLARSLAAMGKRVLLVDVDMLHPSVTQLYKASNSAGVRDVLTGKATDDEAIMESELPNLHVLPIGKRGSTPDHDILARSSFGEALERWKSGYDMVLLDSPPVLSMADARITAAHADGTVMVLRSSGSNREDAVEAFTTLSNAGARLLGTLLVGVNRGSAYYPYYYQQRSLQAAEMLA
ncbi:MAG TPA: polysaccharide biosynthesis tyrosine autokinase [Phycisphaerae bacterium]|nr:polysaccharide biosynthesis tyrosine autokinase [Phycisphaerae bacterium]